MEEKRRFTRVPFKMEAEVRVGDMVYRSAEISNLSVGGCLLPICGDLQVGTQCRVKISLGGAGQDVAVVAEGLVVRIQRDAVAIKFTSVDPDSLFHLRNIIRYNSADPDAVDREIRDHSGIV
ncbi:MAG: PilZ domain-containing protein [Deltaproteobacteria bacterium]|nr:PilZ domain-containing protein [Deltaproteobacteria bacterium]